MITRFAVPFLILAAVFLPLPFALGPLVFGILLAVRPRGEPFVIPAPAVCPPGPLLVRGPPR